MSKNAQTAETTETQEQETSSPQYDEQAEFEEVNFSTLIPEADEDDGQGDLSAEAAPEQVDDAAQTESKSEEGTDETPEPVAEETPPQEEEAEKKAEEGEEEEEKGKLPEPEPEPEVKMPTREELEGLYTEHREKTLPELEKLFALSDEQVEAFQDNPGEVLPKLAAQMMYDSMMSSYNAVMAAMPSVVNRMISVSRETEQAENAFFDRWEDLKDPKYSQVVKSSIRAYRQANPRASRDDVIEKAGMLAMMQAGLDPTKKKAEETTPAPKPKPSARPAGAGASASPMPPKNKGPEDDNVFAELTDLFQDSFS